MNKKTSVKTTLDNTLYHYAGAKNSGAYVFKPDGQASILTSSVSKFEVTIMKFKLDLQGRFSRRMSNQLQKWLYFIIESI